MDHDRTTTSSSATSDTTASPDREPTPPGGTGDTRSVLPRLLAIAATVAVLAVAGLLFLGNVLADDDEPVVLDEREGRLSAEAYSAVELGATKDDVLTALRPVLPTGTRVLDRYEEREPETVAAECVYYDREDGRAGQQYRFCFVEDVLVGKTLVLAGDPGEGSAVVDGDAVDG